MGCDSKKGCAVFVNRDSIGAGGELGRNLIKAALYVLSESDEPPCAIAFMNEGVYLTAGEDEDILENLRSLEAGGTEILSCGTCLDYYGIAEKLKVGIVSNMYDIITTLQSADKTITL